MVVIVVVAVVTKVVVEVTAEVGVVAALVVVIIVATAALRSRKNSERSVLGEEQDVWCMCRANTVHQQHTYSHLILEFTVQVYSAVNLF